MIPPKIRVKNADSFFVLKNIQHMKSKKHCLFLIIQFTRHAKNKAFP